MKEKKISFSISSSEIVKDYKSSTLSKIKLDIVSVGNNKHGLPISLQAIESAKDTLIGTRITCKINNIKKDFQGHEEDSIVVGVITSAEDIFIEEREDGSTWLCAYGIIWKDKYPNVVEIIEDKGNETSISMEISVLHDEDEDELTKIEMFFFRAITLIGVSPAVENAKAELCFSADESVKSIKRLYYSEKDVEDNNEKHYVPEVVKENVNKAFELHNKYGFKEIGFGWEMANSLKDNDFVGLKDISLINDYFASYQEDSNSRVNSKKYFNFYAHGGKEASDWSLEIIENLDNDIISHRKEENMKDDTNTNQTNWEFSIDGEVGTLKLNGEVTQYSWWGEEITPGFVQEKLSEMGNIETLNVYINSPGGEVFAGQTIYHMLKELDCTINIYINVLAASIASVISMAGDKVYMTENAIMMIHKASTLGYGNADDMEKTKKVLDAIDNSITSIYSAKTGLGEEKILELLKEETWMTAKEALEYGFIDEIMPLNKEDKDTIVKDIDYSFAKNYTKTPIEFSNENKNDEVGNEDYKDDEPEEDINENDIEDNVDVNIPDDNEVDDDETDDIEDEITLKENIENLQKEITDLKEENADLQDVLVSKDSLIEELQNFKNETEQEKLNKIINKSLAMATGKVPDDVYDDLVELSKDFNLENVNDFANYIKATLYDYNVGNDSNENKMLIFDTNSKKRNKKKDQEPKSFWDKQKEKRRQ